MKTKLKTIKRHLTYQKQLLKNTMKLSNMTNTIKNYFQNMNYQISQISDQKQLELTAKIIKNLLQPRHINI